LTGNHLPAIPESDISGCSTTAKPTCSFATECVSLDKLLDSLERLRLKLLDRLERVHPKLLDRLERAGQKLLDSLERACQELLSREGV
jgi:hypothetical protein